MGGKWQEYLLGTLTDWSSGGTPSKDNPAYWGGAIPWISASSMKSGRLFESDRTITEAGLKNGSRIAPPGAVLLLVRGSELHKRIPIGIALCPVAFNQDVKALLPRAGIESSFLYYWLTGNASMLLQKVEHTGIGAGKLDTKVMQALPVCLPSLPEQRAIAHILGTLDDKIELNRRMNETLEAMARALFKSWFVDFDPVRAKRDGRDTGLPRPLADLFPDSFEDSELGEIPKGWKPSNVGKHFNLTMGQSPPGSTYNESGDGLPFFQGRTDFGFRFPSRRVFCTAPTRLAEVGDTLVSVRAPVGDVNIAIEHCAVGRGVAAVRHCSGSRSFTYHAMHNLGEHFDKFEGEGTVFGSINKIGFERLPFVAPPKVVLDCFERLTSPIDDQVESNEVESRTIAVLRDMLLPKLISGELRVRDAKEITKEVIDA